MGAFALYVPGDGPADAAVVRRMLASAPHRGSRFDVDVVGGCALGVSNFEDRTDAWLAVEGTMGALVVGRIDNLAELAKRALEHEPRLGATPAEVVLARA